MLICLDFNLLCVFVILRLTSEDSCPCSLWLKDKMPNIEKYSFIKNISKTRRNQTFRIRRRQSESSAYVCKTCMSSVPDSSYVKLSGALVYRNSYPPPERRSECPVSCSLDSCLSRRCLSLSLRLTSRPP